MTGTALVVRDPFLKSYNVSHDNEGSELYLFEDPIQESPEISILQNHGEHYMFLRQWCDKNEEYQVIKMSRQQFTGMVGVAAGVLT